MSNRPLPFRAVLFDLDNTLNDRAQSWKKFVAMLLDPIAPELHPSDPETVLQIIVTADHDGYRPKDEFLADLQTNLNWIATPSIEEINHLWRQRFPGCMVTRDGVIELLTKLKQTDIPTAIVTNGKTSMQRAKIDAMGLGMLVNSVVISESVGVKKPDPRIFELARSNLEAVATQTLFVGDHPELDIIGSSKSGMKTAWLANGANWNHPNSRPDFILSRFSELDAILFPRE